MKVNHKIEKLLENWPQKIICFVIAILIYIFYNISALDSKYFNVPLQLQANAGYLPLGSYPSHVRVSIRGKSEDLTNITEKDFFALLDLDGCTKNGKDRFPVELNLSERLMLIENIECRVTPSSVELRVEEQISDYSNVKPLIYGEPAKGYYVENIKTTPSKVKITGPRSMVENCNRLQTSRVNIEGASVPLKQKVLVENSGDFLELSETSEITVEVNILPKKLEKEFKNIPIVSLNLRDDLEIKSKSEVSAKITGNLIDLEKYMPTTGDFAVNFNGIDDDGEYELPVISKLPSKYSVEFSSNVKVSVQNKPESTGNPENSKNDHEASN